MYTCLFNPITNKSFFTFCPVNSWKLRCGHEAWSLHLKEFVVWETSQKNKEETSGTWFPSSWISWYFYSLCYFSVNTFIVLGGKSADLYKSCQGKEVWQSLKELKKIQWIPSCISECFWAIRNESQMRKEVMLTDEKHHRPVVLRSRPPKCICNVWHFWYSACSCRERLWWSYLW